jgi:hypothetical protein
VEACAQRLRWPELSDPDTGRPITGAAAWRDVLRELRQRRTMTGVWALERLADDLHALEKGGPLVTPGMSHRVAEDCAESHDDVTNDGVQPSAREMGTFARAVMAAQAQGLGLRPDVTRFTWFDATEGYEAWGYTGRRDGGVIEVSLQRGLPDQELFRTIVHELQHVQDLIALGERCYDLGMDELERRANAFEARVMLAEGFA